MRRNSFRTSVLLNFQRFFRPCDDAVFLCESTPVIRALSACLFSGKDATNKKNLSLPVRHSLCFAHLTPDILKIAKHFQSRKRIQVAAGQGLACVRLTLCSHS